MIEVDTFCRIRFVYEYIHLDIFGQAHMVYILYTGVCYLYESQQRGYILHLNFRVMDIDNIP